MSRFAGVGKPVRLRSPLVLVGILLLVGTPARAQTLTNGVFHTRQPVFRIPFETDPGGSRLREVRLFVSEDQGQTWQQGGVAPPEQRSFSFRAPHDGLYAFTVQTLDFEGRLAPPSSAGFRPHIRVLVDTQPPLITLRAGYAREGASVEWDIREENLDLASFVLEYRSAGTEAEWLPLRVVPGPTGQHTWNPTMAGPLDVRLRVRDLAKNEGTAQTTVTPGQSFQPSSAFPDRSGSASPARSTLPGVKYVGSKQIALNYQVDEVGPSGVASVEVWFTRDTQSWEKLNEQAIKDEPKVPGRHTFTVQDEGRYGFSLVAVSGVGRHARAPRAGDPPQIWVIVDTVKPEVTWVNTDVGQGLDKGKLFITWKATDLNFGPEPITLSYSANGQAPWTQIAANLPNNGRYEWNMPSSVPPKFHVRLEATDRAGNVGTFETKLVIVDLSEPKGIILDAQPAARQGS
jgi:hypothetical protein